MSHDAVKQPLLLDGAYRPEAPLNPVSLAVREEAGGIAMAVMALAGGPAVGVGRMVRLWNGADEDLGVFRVTRAMTETGRGGRLRLELEHCLACLCDCVLPYAVSVGTTVSAAVRTLLSSGGAPMTLASAGTDAAISRTGFVGVTVWEAVSTVLASLPEGWRLEVGGDGPPWDLRIAAAESAPCVLSAGRSLISLNCEADLTDYCSRMYPIGKDGLTVRGVNGGDPWVRLTDSPAYGVASRMLSRPDVDSAAQLKTLALQELARLSEPVLSVRAEARELYAETGEDADRFTPGRLCVIPTDRLPGPWTGELRCRVVTRSWPDLVRDPRRVVLTLGSRRPRLSAAVPAQKDWSRWRMYG